MRANRLLGASLVEHNLVSIDDLDVANERLLELISNSASSQQISLLSILASEKQKLDENKLFEHLIEEESLGIIDVRNIEIPEELRSVFNTGECWATWTVPFDLVEDTRYLATAYYLSPVVRQYWEDKVQGKVVWFAASLESITDFLEKYEAELANKAMTAN
ncbi:MAG: hypothetical protein AAGB46_05820 [Verrucomicrobiota bacterium]